MTRPTDPAARLQSLEETLLHQDRTIEQLGEVLRDQTLRLERLERALAQLRERLDQAVAAASEADEPS